MSWSDPKFITLKDYDAETFSPQDRQGEGGIIVPNCVAILRCFGPKTDGSFPLLNILFSSSSPLPRPTFSTDAQFAVGWLYAPDSVFAGYLTMVQNRKVRFVTGGDGSKNALWWMDSRRDQETRNSLAEGTANDAVVLGSVVNPPPGPVGRFSVVDSPGDPPILLDTATGQAWATSGQVVFPPRLP